MYVQPIQPWTQSPLKLVGDAGTLFQKDDTTLTAVDVETLTTKWSLVTSGTPVMAVAGGGVAIHDAATGIISVVDSSGAITSTDTLVSSTLTSGLEQGQLEAIDAGSLSAV